MATQVFVQRDGIVNHRHEGVKGWHDPATKHAILKLHEGADLPAVVKDLTADQKAQYKKALAGTSFNWMWIEAKEARRKAALEAGQGWNYGKKAEPVAEGLTPEQEADALAAGFSK